MLRQVHAHPKLIMNKAGATCTDTIHRIRFKEDVNGEHVVSAFMNSMTFAFSEVMGRSYGGGVLTFEPTEAERMPLSLKGIESISFKEIDKYVRLGKLDSVLDITDEAILRNGLGLSMKDIRSLRGIWIKMRDRRILRTHSIVE